MWHSSRRTLQSGIGGVAINKGVGKVLKVNKRGVAIRGGGLKIAYLQLCLQIMAKDASLGGTCKDIGL